jgi:hypothetical protein
MVMDKTPELPGLPYESIGPQLHALLETVVNRCDRDWPQKWRDKDDTRYIVLGCARINRNTYNSLRWLLADEPKRSERRIEYALSAIPVVRSIADTVFLLVFLFGDVEEHTKLYFRGGWREMKEDFDRHVKQYGADPEWDEWLKEFGAGLERTRTQSHVTEAEASDLKALPYWPTPHQMLKGKALPPDDRTFLRHLDDWFYKSFSSYTHLSLPGLIMRSTALRTLHDEEQERIRLWRVDKQRSDAIAMAILLSLSVLTEISAACSFELSSRLSYIWGVIIPYFGMAKHLHDRRYARLLADPGT